MKKETLRLETKQTRQMTELKAKNEAIVKELDEVYVRYSTVGMHMFTAEQLFTVKGLVIGSQQLTGYGQ